MKFFSALFATVLGLAGLQPASAAPVFSNIFVFGDSLSDPGNISLATGGAVQPKPYTDPIPSLAYDGGRFSNGPVWVEQLASKLGLSASPALIGGTNFAFGGAVTGPLTGVTPSVIPTLTQQAAQLLSFLGPSFPTLPSDALYVVFGGGNDVRAALATGNPATAAQIVTDGVTNLGGIIGNLAAAGAKNFLVPGLPDLGRAPAVQLLGPTAIGAATQLSLGFNAGLTNLLSTLALNPSLNITALPLISAVDTVFNNPAAFGFTNVTDMCILQNSGAGCSNPDEFLFWDGIHPTTAGHKLIADAAFAVLSPAPVPIPVVFPLFAPALLLIARRRRAA